MNKTIFRSRYSKIALAVSISLILLVAAITKIIYPSELLLDFYIALGVFEMILALSLLMFSGHWQVWAFLALVFATWMGYSSFATIVGLPCPCLGSAVDIPRGTMLVVDSLVLAPSWMLLMKDKRFTSKYVKKLAILSGLFFVVGFIFPEVIYKLV
jgi:hypothetical protein